MGRAMAEQLLTPGHHLITLARSPLALARPTQAQHLHGEHWEHWESDLSAPSAAAQRLETWLRAQAPHTYASATLINNAGVIPPIAPLAETDGPAIAHALRVGLEAPMLLCSAFLRATRSWAGRKKILNISSGLGRRAMASQATYCAAKAGLDNFSAALALEEALQPHGALVCSLAPGVIDTAMQEQLRSTAAHNFPDVQRFQALHSQGLLTSPQAAARQILGYLASADFGKQPIADIRTTQHS